MPAGKYPRRQGRDSNVAQLFRRHWFAWRKDENCHEAHNRGDGPEAALGWTVPSVQFSPRVVKSTEHVTEAGQLTRALVRFLRRRSRLHRAGGRFRKSENGGRSAQMAWSPNHMATTKPRAAGMKRYNRANTAGRGLDTALGSSVSSPLAFFRLRGQASWEVNRGRAANVAPGPVFPPLLVFSRATWSPPPEK